MGSSARLTLVILLICVLGTALLLDGRKEKAPEGDGDIPTIKSEVPAGRLDPSRGNGALAKAEFRPKQPKPKPARFSDRIRQHTVTGQIEESPGRHGPIVRRGVSETKQPPVKRDPGSYTVEEGDNLWKIAKKRLGSGAYANLIRKANPQLAKQRYLKVGQKLIIPAVSSGAGLAQSQRTTRPAARQDTRSQSPGRRSVQRTGGARTHTVRPGDKLWNLASRYLGSGAKHWKIYERNRDRIDNPDRLRVGTVLIIPAR